MFLKNKTIFWIHNTKMHFLFVFWQQLVWSHFLSLCHRWLSSKIIAMSSCYYTHITKQQLNYWACFACIWIFVWNGMLCRLNPILNPLISLLFDLPHIGNIHKWTVYFLTVTMMFKLRGFWICQLLVSKNLVMR